ncbi:hypothetical protein, partial [Pseudomonas sp. 2995-3]|uniref:hypothetical protein n=1 Tax=Pseudomonas sp. 2995-3 TaxID=1712680 RepID=UPI001C4720E1
FILSAKTLGQKVILIESTYHYNRIMERLNQELSKSEISDVLYYISNYDFYEMYGDFKFENVLKRFKNVIQPYYNE